MIPTFRYHPDPFGSKVFYKGEPHRCDCCGKETEVWYESPFYSLQDVECLCPQCIADGSAAAKFNGEFQDSANVDPVSDPENIDSISSSDTSLCDCSVSPVFRSLCVWHVDIDCHNNKPWRIHIGHKQCPCVSEM
jgi:hypothetical protein